MTSPMDLAAMAAQRAIKNNQVSHNSTGLASTSVARKAPQGTQLSIFNIPTIWDGSTSSNARYLQGTAPVDATSGAVTGANSQQAALAALRAKIPGTYFGPNQLRMNR